MERFLCIFLYHFWLNRISHTTIITSFQEHENFWPFISQDTLLHIALYAKCQISLINLLYLVQTKKYNCVIFVKNMMHITIFVHGSWNCDGLNCHQPCHLVCDTSLESFINTNLVQHNPNMISWKCPQHIPNTSSQRRHDFK